MSTKDEYFDALTDFAIKFINTAREKDFSGSMMLAWSEGKITSFKPSPIFGVSQISGPMGDMFNGE